MRLVGALVVFAASAAVLLAARNDLVAVADGAVLVASLASVARTAIRTAAEPRKRTAGSGREIR